MYSNTFLYTPGQMTLLAPGGFLDALQADPSAGKAANPVQLVSVSPDRKDPFYPQVWPGQRAERFVSFPGFILPRVSALGSDGHPAVSHGCMWW